LIYGKSIAPDVGADETSTI